MYNMTDSGRTPMNYYHIHNNHSAKNMTLTGLTIKLTLEKSLK